MSNTYKLLRALSTELDVIDQQAEKIRRTTHVDTSTDKHLDKLALLANTRRKQNEPDEKFRKRIIATIRGRSAEGTLDEVLSLAATLLEMDVEDISYEKQVANLVLTIEQSSLEDTTLTPDEIVELTENSVTAGGSIGIQAEGTFELSSDSYTPPSGTGLTDDSGTEGGTLGQDINA